jgi:hypothetical protein
LIFPYFLWKKIDLGELGEIVQLDAAALQGLEIAVQI